LGWGVLGGKAWMGPEGEDKGGGKGSKVESGGVLQ